MGFFDKLKKTDGERGDWSVFSPVSGRVVPMKSIEDEVFSEGILGVCCGIEPECETVVSPIDGQVIEVSETLHAVGIEGDGVEILIHVGIDTVDMNGDGFEVSVKAGDRIKRGESLLKMDREKIKKAGHPTTVVTVITNSRELESVKTTEREQLDAGDELFKIRK